MNDFEEFNVTPELTLDPFQEEKKETPQIYQEAEPETPEIVLTPEEKNMVSAFAEKIDLANSNMILQYGAGTQKKIADFSEKALENVKTKDLGEVGTLLSDVVTELKGFDEEEEKGFLGIFKKGGNKIQAMKAKYAKAETNVNNIVKALESHEVQLMKDIALLDKMYEVNLTYYKELAMYVLAGKQKLAETRNGELQELKNKAMASGLAEDAQAAKDLDSRCERFEKKLHDLELTKTIAMQTAPQIRLVQGNDTMMAEKIQSTLVNTIPLWKSQMVLALGVEHSAQAAAAQREVNDMTNELLRKNAEKLKIATVETARSDDQCLFFQNLFCRLFYDICNLRNYRADDRSFQLLRFNSVNIQNHLDINRIFQFHLCLDRGKSFDKIGFIVIHTSKYNICISYINRKYHFLHS